jgi:putative addiction module component (TIGR02574 family)
MESGGSAVPTFDSVLKTATQLADFERRELAVRLFLSLNDSLDAAADDAAFAFEIKKRIDEMESGAVKSYSWEEVQKSLKAIIKKHSRAHHSSQREAGAKKSNGVVRAKKPKSRRPAGAAHT